MLVVSVFQRSPELADRLGRGDPGEGAQRHAEPGRVGARGLGDEGDVVGRLHAGGLLEGGCAEEGAVGRAGGVDRVDLALEVDADVLGGDVAPALGRVLVPEARALVDGEDVGGLVRDLREGGDVGLHDALFLVAPADQGVHVPAHPVLGGAEDAAVGVEVVVRFGGGGDAQFARRGWGRRRRLRRWSWWW